MPVTLDKLKEARASGYSDSEIASYLNDSKINEAIENGYTLDDVIGYFEKKVAPAPQQSNRPLDITYESLTKNFDEPMSRVFGKQGLYGPTYLGRKTGAPEGSFIEGVASSPERFVRSFPAAAAAGGALVNTAIGSLGTMADRWSGGKLTQLGKYLATPNQMNTVPYSPYPGMQGSAMSMGSKEQYPTPAPPLVTPAAAATYGAGKKYYEGLDDVAKANASVGGAGLKGALEMAGMNLTGAPALAERAAMTLATVPGKVALSSGKGAQNVAAGIVRRGLGVLKKEASTPGAIKKQEASIIKHKIFESPAKFHEEASTKIGNAMRALDEHLASNPDPSAAIDLQAIADRALERGIAGTETGSKGIRSAYDDFVGNIKDKNNLPDESPLGMIPLTKAQLIKRETGAKADWNKWHPQGSQDKGTFQNLVYDELRKEIETKGGDAIKEYNRIASDLIDLDRAAVKRMIVKSRNNPISLDKVVALVAAIGTGSTVPLSIAAVNAGSKSAFVARQLARAGRAAEKAGKFLGGDVSLAERYAKPVVPKPTMNLDGNLSDDFVPTSQYPVAHRSDVFIPSKEQRGLFQSAMQPKRLALPAPTMAERILAIGTEPTGGMIRREIAASKRKIGKLEKRNAALGEQMEVPQSPQPLKTAAQSQGLGRIFNERGAIGGIEMYGNYTPAIKDPVTGKVYVGKKYFGHKAISKNGESPEIQSRLHMEYFKDNRSGGNTPSVGFIDKDGNFISRNDLENKFSKSQSLAQQFHEQGSSAPAMLGGMTLGGVGGSAAGAQVGDTPQERARNAAIGGVAGMVGGSTLGMVGRRGIGSMGKIVNNRGAIGGMTKTIDKQVYTKEFKEAFGDWEKNPQTATKVVDKNGIPLPVYSGHSNVTLYGKKYDPRKTTAGAFYASEDPAIASNYAMNKFGSKESYEGGNQFRFADKKGNYTKKINQVELTQDQLKKLDKLKAAKDAHGNNVNFISEMDRYIESNKNYDKDVRRWAMTGGSKNLKNIHDFMESMGYTIRHNSKPDDPNIRFNSTEHIKPSEFDELLDYIGVDWNDYEKASPGVMKVYLDIKNPLDANKPFPADLLRALEEKAKYKRNPTMQASMSNQWTKDYPMKQWVQDIKDGNEYWTTHIPKEALPIIKAHGYDGIKELGMKGSEGKRQTNWLVFDANQIKSATGNTGSFSKMSNDMTRGLPLTAGATLGSAAAYSGSNKRKGMTLKGD